MHLLCAVSFPISMFTTILEACGFGRDGVLSLIGPYPHSPECGTDAQKQLPHQELWFPGFLHREGMALWGVWEGGMPTQAWSTYPSARPSLSGHPPLNGDITAAGGSGPQTQTPLPTRSPLARNTFYRINLLKFGGFVTTDGVTLMNAVLFPWTDGQTEAQGCSRVC